MPYMARLLAAAAVVTIGVGGPVLAQTQPRVETLGTRIPDPGEADRWKAECERRADEKRLKGKRRTSAIKKCVNTGKLPRELQ